MFMYWLFLHIFCETVVGGSYLRLSTCEFALYIKCFSTKFLEKVSISNNITRMLCEISNGSNQTVGLCPWLEQT